jgi:hypothetical protein
VVLGEASGERLGERGDLRTHPPFREVSEHGRVTLAGDERLEHRPAGDPADVGGHRGELDAGAFEELLEALDLPVPFTGDRRAGAGEVAQLADRLGRDEPPTDEPARAQIGEPRPRRRSFGQGDSSRGGPSRA